MNDQPTDYSSIDSFHVGRRRKPNFTDQEVLNIVDQYDTYKELLHSREASKSVIAQKQTIWKQITDNLNATYPQVERTVEDVRRKWKKLQSEAKREAAAYQAAQLSGSNTSISSKQINLYNRILNICRPSSNATGTPSSHFNQAAFVAALQQQQHRHHHQQVSQPFRSNHHDTSFNEQSSDKDDSPSSEVAVGTGSTHLDSPNDEESPSLLGNDDNSASPKSNLQSTSLSSFLPPQATNPSSSTGPMSNGQISRRTLDKRRKLLKASVNYSALNNHTSKSYGQQQHSLRYESLLKRKRTLELTSQRLINDKQRLLLERKNLEVKLASNECENERVAIEKRRTELALQKLQSDLSSANNEVNNHNLSDQEDHDDNNSLDDMSDIND